MCIEALEDGAMIDIVQHLRLALKIGKIDWLTKLRGQLLHERSDISITTLVPIMVGPGIAERPLVSRRDGVLERLQGGHGWRAHLHRETPVQGGKEFRRRLVTVRSTVLQVHLVGTGGVVTS